MLFQLSPFAILLFDALTSANFLDGCYHVYLDVGSNVGIQVRKLYEPHLYPNSGIFPMFDSFFGKYGDRNLSQICSVGFEPNPHHESRLKKLQTSYRSCGWPVTFYNAAVGNETGLVTLKTDGNKERLEWGASIANNFGLKSSLGEVQMMRLSSFVKNLVAVRRLPKIESGQINVKPPAVLMKMDIEGSEIEVISDLLLTGSFQHINKTLIEFHHYSGATKERKRLSFALAKSVETLREISGQPDLVEFDDESFGISNFDLPNCH